MKIIKTAKYIEKISKMEPWEIPSQSYGNRIEEYNHGVYPEWMQQDREDSYFGVMKECERCHQKVKMDPRNSICDECADGQSIMQETYDQSGVNTFEGIEKDWGEEKQNIAEEERRERDRFKNYRKRKNEKRKKDRQMGLASVEQTIKTAQEENGYFYSFIAETIQKIEQYLPGELEKIKRHSDQIRDLENQILALSKTQPGVTEGQDYYGNDYFSQNLAADQGLMKKLNDSLDEMSIWDLPSTLLDYKEKLQSMLRDLKWNQKSNPR
jgi:hypothetical protein